MKIACAWCTHPLIIEDAKIPPQTFLTRCPKCTGTIQVPGRDNPGGVAAKHGPPPEQGTGSGNGSTPESAGPAATPSTGASAAASTPAPPKSEPTAAATGGSGQRALVALDDARLASAMASLLNQQGYAVESLSPMREKLRLLHQGDYELVVTSPAGPVLEEGKTLHRRMDHLSPESRRRTFLILIGDEFQTGDGTQAFVAAADLVAHPSALGDVGAFLAHRMDERVRVYRAFRDAEGRRDQRR